MFSLPLVYAQSAPSVTASLVSGETSLKATYEQAQVKIAPDARILDRLIDGQRNESQAEMAEAPQILVWLKARARSKGYPQYVARITDLGSLSRERPDIVNALMPSRAEFSALGPDEQTLVRHWTASYVGVWNPRLRLTIDNTSNPSPFNIQSIRFEITYADFSDRMAFDSRLNSAVLDTFYVPLVPQPRAVEVRWDSTSTQDSLIPGSKIGKLDVVFLPDPELSKTAKRIICNGRLSLRTSRGELRAGEISIDTYNSWIGGALKR